NREKKATTGLGEGFALPHVRTMEARDLAMALLRVPEGVDFDAIDQKPVYLFLAMVAPPYDDNLYLRIYRDIAKGISADLREELLQATHLGDVYGALKKY
ncbi:MAG: PTS sugar transporter subunit IIA, partial [Planctomycetota bacterium]